MTHADYHARAALFSAEAQRLRSRYERLTWVRLLAFVAAVALAILLWQWLPWWGGLVGTLVLIGLFARLVRWHGRIQRAARHQERLAEANEDEIRAGQHDFAHLPAGESFVDQQHPYTYDLDIFGPHAIFQYLNRGRTSIGQARLASWLQHPADTGTIRQRQEAVRELASQLDWRQHFQAHGAALEEEAGQIDRLRSWLDSPPVVLGHRWRTLALWLAPLLSVVGIALWITVLPWFAAILFFVPAGWWLRGAQEEVNRLHSLTGRASDTLNQYARLIAHTEEASFDSPLLQALRATFTTGEAPASRAIKRLAYRLSQLDVRYNPFVLLLEFTVVWDLQQAYRLDRWQATYREQLPRWFGALAELEALLSLATLHYNQSGWVIPEITNEAILQATDLGHPLIPADKRVGNDLQMPTHGHMHLITGSNMAGKSTWLRSVGVNLVLALAGGPVCARSMRLPQLQVYTSMRTQDALHESTSSFFAELKRLKFIIEAVEDPSHTDGRPVFFLLDEILKGTNSRDRHTGAKALIQQLIRSKGAGLIATHDLELGVLEADSEGRIENWAIEVAIRDGQLYFDYTLQRGVSQSFNATLLMQRMGIKIDP
ncbi:MAG: hypothetical protein KDC54_14795 [Lewinella sp.]|nr:hypothetical protein [Lewinella sp.]